MNEKNVEVKVSRDDFGIVLFAVAFMIIVFHGDPSISECLRVMFAHWAGLKP